MQGEPTESVVVSCDVELLRRGIERAAQRVGVAILNCATEEGTRTGQRDRRGEYLTTLPLLTVQGGSICVVVTDAVPHRSWDAIRRLINELFGTSNDHHRKT